MNQFRAFENVTDQPCPVCLRLVMLGKIQGRAVMPLPKFPARSRVNNEKLCKDCQAAEILQQLGGHPKFIASRLTVANDRCEGLMMPFGFMERFGLCSMGYIQPCSLKDLGPHSEWLASHGIADSSIEECIDDDA